MRGTLRHSRHSG